jgi:predicted nucleic acid-binding protein
MAWVKDLAGKTVALDSAPLIYYVEKHPIYFRQVLPFFDALKHKEFEAITSVITITEVLVHPFHFKRLELVEIYREILLNYLRLCPVSTKIAEIAASLRAGYHFKTPDALQVATALDQKADFFLTNDSKLAHSRLSGLRILALSESNE